MKTLFVSDLDGTLLNSNAELSEKSAALINKSISEGALFTVATARTFATVLQIFDGVALNLPIVLMNGVMVYDPTEKRILSCHSITRSKTEEIISVFKRHGIFPMLYRNRETYLEIEYFSTDNPNQMKYVNARAEKDGKRFIYSTDFSAEGTGEIIYIVTLDTYERILPVYKDICGINGISCAFYSDNYTGCYFLEIFADKVSKASSVAEVVKLTGAESIIAFGDNLNDIEMFKRADEAYAVENACQELKKIATSVIGSNESDSVAEFIYNRITENNNEQDI